MMDPNPALNGALESLLPTHLPTIQPGLERIEALLATLGNPERKLPPVVHVAGTNGKGSTIAFMHAALKAAGLKVHVYHSPHLVRFAERITLANVLVSDDVLLKEIATIKPLADAHDASFYEATTALAFKLFAEVPADIVLLETGLGGRWDATNVVETPLLTIITPIGLDHTEFLGDSLAEIAAEKAGIMKAGVPCVLAHQEPDAKAVFDSQAKKLGIKTYTPEWQRTNAGFHMEHHSYPAPSLFGEHQYANAALAVEALTLLEAKIPALTHKAVVQGVASASWPARMQKLSAHPFNAQLPHTDIWLDGGHNPHAAEVIAHWAKTQSCKITLVLGMLANKDAAGYLSPLMPYLEQVVLVPLAGQPCQTAASIAPLLPPNTGFHASERLDQAMELLAKHPPKGAVLIAGSLYLAGSVLSRASL